MRPWNTIKSFKTFNLTLNTLVQLMANSYITFYFLWFAQIKAIFEQWQTLGHLLDLTYVFLHRLTMLAHSYNDFFFPHIQKYMCVCEVQCLPKACWQPLAATVCVCIKSLSLSRFFQHVRCQLNKCIIIWRLSRSSLVRRCSAWLKENGETSSPDLWLLFSAKEIWGHAAKNSVYTSGAETLEGTSVLRAP